MTEDRQLILTRLIMAPPPKVWRCWTDPALLPRWFGPEGFSCQTKEINLRPGGVWRFDMIGPDGTVWPNRHRFTRHDPPNRIDFLLDGDDDAQPPIEVEITMTPDGEGTLLTQTMTLPSAAAKAHALGFGADRLGQQTMGKLAALAETL